MDSKKYYKVRDVDGMFLHNGVKVWNIDRDYAVIEKQLHAPDYEELEECTAVEFRGALSMASETIANQII